MNTFIKFLKSTRLAIVLLLVITVLSILSTLIPQGKADDFYVSAYPSFLSFLILTTGFHNYSSSLVLIIPVVFFCINLSVCTIERLVREFKRKTSFRNLRFGPDIIHIGILVLIIGSLFTITGRVEEFAYLKEGDTIAILDKYMLMVENLEFVQYDDGRPKDWISTLSIAENSHVIVSSYPVEVNNPLNFKELSIMQTSYYDEPVLIVSDLSGTIFHWAAGHMVETNEATILFHGLNKDPYNEKDYVAMFEKSNNDGSVDLIYGKPPDIIGGYILEKVYFREVTGLTFIIDPGFVPVVIGLILIGLGLSLTFIQKIGVKKV